MKSTRLHLNVGQFIVVFMLASFTAQADPPPRPAAAVVENFQDDPRQHDGFTERGPGSEQFVYTRNTPSHFCRDQQGTLTATTNTLLPTTRYYTPLNGKFTDADDFTFGAILTVRPDAFAADPDGYAQIAFSLFNSQTTGDERTGNDSNYNVNTFDSLEFDYYPNVSPFFGGPFLSPTVFGDQVGDTAFNNFNFTSNQATLALGVPYLIEADYSAGAQKLIVRVSSLSESGLSVPLANGEIILDTSLVSHFTVDTLGIAAYHDGYNEYADSGRSLFANVDYDLLFSGGPGSDHSDQIRNTLRDVRTHSCVGGGGDVNCGAGIPAAGATVLGNLRVSQGVVCTLSGVHIGGNVQLDNNASLIATGVTIGGDVQGHDGTTLVLDDTSVIGGNFQSENSVAVGLGATVYGDVQIHKTSGSLSGGNYVCSGGIWGNFQLQETTASATFDIGGTTHCAAGNSIYGNAELQHNAGAVHFADNAVGHDLHCEQNTALTTARNHVYKNTQCQ